MVRLGLKGWVGIFLLALVFISFTIMLLNKPKCEPGTYNSELTQCFYNLASVDAVCSMGQAKNLVDGVVSCTYPANYKINNNYLWIIIGVAGLSGIVLILYIVFAGSKKPVERVMLMPDMAEDLALQNLASRLPIPHMVGESWDVTRWKNFRTRPVNKLQWALQNEDYAHRFEVEVLSGPAYGIYTVTMNLYKTAEQISNGFFSVHPLKYGDFKDSRSKPIELSKSPAERMLSSYGYGLSEEMREKSKEKFQEQIIAEVSKQPSDDEDGEATMYKPGGQKYERKKPQKLKSEVAA